MNLSARKAHVFNTLKTCEALEENGTPITFVTTLPMPDAHIFQKEVLDYVGIKKHINIVSLNSPVSGYLYSTSIFKRMIAFVVDSYVISKYLFLQRKKINTLYLRDHLLIGVVMFSKLFLRKKIFFEAHYKLSKKISQFLVFLCVYYADGVITITHSLEKIYKKINKHCITLFCAASEPELFVLDQTKESLRESLDLPQNKILIGYTGNMYLTGNNDSYGIEDVICALPLLSPGYVFVGVGKKDASNMQHENLAKKLGVEDRVIILPWTNKSKVIDYITAFDVLVIPASGNRIGNSPTKIFEYLPSGRPIVAAQTDAITEVLSDRVNSFIVDYKNPQSWANALSYVTTRDVSSIVSQAKKDAFMYTWSQRAKGIIGFVDSI